MVTEITRICYHHKYEHALNRVLCPKCGFPESCNCGKSNSQFIRWNRKWKIKLCIRTDPKFQQLNGVRVCMRCITRGFRGSQFACIISCVFKNRMENVLRNTSEMKWRKWKRKKNETKRRRCQTCSATATVFYWLCEYANVYHELIFHVFSTSFAYCYYYFFPSISTYVRLRARYVRVRTYAFHDDTYCVLCVRCECCVWDNNKKYSDDKNFSYLNNRNSNSEENHKELTESEQYINHISTVQLKHKRIRHIIFIIFCIIHEPCVPPTL